MDKRALQRDLLSDPDDEVIDRSQSSDSDQEEAEVGEQRQSVQDRKRAAFYPPISSVCSALGGFEEFKDKDGTIKMEYSLGDQVISQSTRSLSPYPTKLTCGLSQAA